MKSSLIIVVLFAFSTHLYAQFSLGSDLISLGLSHAPQLESGLMADTLILNRRLIFETNFNLVGAYKYKHWEFSLGVGHEGYHWKQKFHALTPDVKAFLGSDSQSDSSDYLGKITYRSRLVALPVGVKYLFNDKPDSWINAFVSLRLMPAFAYQQSAKAAFYDQGVFIFIPYPIRAEEDPALVATTEAYFQSKMSHFVLDSRIEAGFRLWGAKQKYAVDFSMGWQRGIKSMHQQIGLKKGTFVNLALRFFFTGQSNPEA